MEQESFAEIADLRRRIANMSKAELARRMGVTPSSLGPFLRGDKMPTETTIYKVALALGCSPRELLPEDVPLHIRAEAKKGEEERRALDEECPF